MDPITLAALISGGGSALASILGGFFQNSQINEQNALNAQSVADKKLGSTDARGNRTRFVEGKGWVSTYGPTDQALENYFLNQELPEAQDQYQRNAVQSRGQNDIATSLLDEFRRSEKGDARDIENMLYAAASRGVNDSTRAAMEPAMRAALRQGSSNVGKISEAISKGGAEALGTAGLNAKLQAMDFVDSKYDSQRAGLTDLYNSFSGKAAGPLMPSTSPSSGSSALMQQFGGADTSRQVVQNNSFADAVGGVSASLGGIANSIGATQQANKTNALLEAFLSNNGFGSPSSGGVLGSINERTRARGSVF